MHLVQAGQSRVCAPGVSAAAQVKRARKRRSNPKHLAWVRSQGCVVADAGGCSGPVHAHHIRTAANSGTGLKPDDRFAVGLCACHHDAVHRYGHLTFQAMYGINLMERAALLAQASGQEMP